MTQRPLSPNRNNDGTQDSSTTPQRPGGQVSTEVGRNAREGALARRQEARNTFGRTEQLRYPEKLASEDGEQPHWLKILVRVREQNSQAVGGLTTGGTYEETAARRLDQESAAATAARAGGATGASSATGGLLGLIPIGNLLVKATKAVTGAAAGAIAAKISGSNKSKTLTTSIALGLQEPPKAD
jgi:hypothetical protein